MAGTIPHARESCQFVWCRRENPHNCDIASDSRVVVEWQLSRRSAILIQSRVDEELVIKPVLIVGAGPVGMTMASELARYRVPVRIVDKAAQRTDKSKALVLWSRTLELLDRGGGSAPFTDAGFKMLAVNFIAGDKLIGRVTTGGVKSPYPYGLIIPQSETERLLEQRLQNLGVTVERQAEAVSFKSGAESVTAVLRHADGHEETVSADWLIGCDGSHSMVRHAVGATFTGETMNSDWILADVHMTGYPVPDTEASIYWHRDGVFVIFPISPGRYRVLADLPLSDAAQPPAPTLDQTQAIIDRRGPSGLVASDPIWLAGFRIHGRKVSSYRWGRAFLAGDAAHIHSPAGGQGMNTGMQDAFNLAWKLALVIHERCDERLLDSYSPERSWVGDQVLKLADRMTAVATTKNPIFQTLRNAIGHLMLGLQPVQHVLADTMSEVAIDYAHSPLNGPSLDGTGPNPGERVAPAEGQPPVGSGDRPLFGLFAEKTVAIADLIGRFAGLLDPVVRPPLHEGGIWLVRPDGYVACASRDPDVVANYVSALVRPGHAEAGH
jgi:2-polyprenyl-6-methoxyphenol hydroxylase-like FAD-dependent oxidoreductase